MSPLRLIAPCGALVLCGLLSAGNAAAIPAGSTALVDRPTGFGSLPFDGSNESDAGQHTISADGRYVVFSSGADSLLDTDDDASFNVYRFDRQLGRVEQVNTKADGTPENFADDFAASVSSDGRYVAFTAEGGALVGNDAADGVYVKDMVTGRVELASRATGADGAAAGGFTIAEGTISGDGRHVAFSAAGVLHADNADGKDGQTDAYVRNLDAGTTHLVSVKPDGSAGGGVNGTDPPVPDFDGTAVAFESDAQLDPQDTDNSGDAYIRDDIGKATETTCFVSFSTNQTTGADGAEQVDLGGDGKEVAWSSRNGVFYAEDESVAVGKATRVDVAQQGGSTGNGASRPSFEPVTAANMKPKRLYFETLDSLVPFDTNFDHDIYDADVAFIGDANHIHLDTSAQHAGRIDDVSGAQQGAVVAYDSEDTDLPGGSPRFHQVYVRADSKDRNISQTPGRGARENESGAADLHSTHAVSDDGQTVVFLSQATALGADGNRQQVVVRDIVTGKTTLVSGTPDGSPGGEEGQNPSIDAAGDKVAFTSTARNLLVSGNPPGGEHAYVRDLKTGGLALVDRRRDGNISSGNVGGAVISPDGTHVVYTSTAADLPGAPPGNNVSHAYVVDLSNGDTTLVDATPAGAVGNAGVFFDIDTNADGTVVAFDSPASNLGVAGSQQHPQIYVRDLHANTLEWASTPEDGDAAHSDSGNPSLDRAGDRVAFEQFDPAFGHGMPPDHSQVFVRDRRDGSTTLASALPGGAVGNARNPSLSADGKRVAFNTFLSFEGDLSATVAAPSSATAGDDPAPPGVYVRNLDESTARFIQVQPPSLFGTEDVASLDGTGSCLAFRSTAVTPFTDPSYGPDWDHIYLRALDDDCPGTAAHPEPPPGNPPGGAPPPGGDPGPTGPGPGPGPTGPHGNPPVDKTKPVISGAKLLPARFAVGAKATFAFSLSEPAATTIVISQRVRRPHQPTRIVKVVTLTRATTVKGRNRIAFIAKVGRTKLKPGSYQAVLTARDKAGNVSKATKLTFNVVKRSR